MTPDLVVVEASVAELHDVVADLSAASDAFRKVDRQRRMQLSLLTVTAVCTLFLVVGLAVALQRSVANRSDIDTIVAVRRERCLLFNESFERQRQLWIDIVHVSETNRVPPTDPSKLSEYYRLIDLAYKPLVC